MTTATFPELLEPTQRLLNVLEVVDDPSLLAGVRLVAQRVFQPRAYVTVVGETSTGKSSLINGLVGWPLLPAFARPTTAAVTQLALQSEKEPRYFALYRDATMDPLARERFLAESEHPGLELLRLQVRHAAPGPSFEGMQVFDTPGFNSLVEGHEEVLREFLPQSDVIIYVAGYRTGFQQADQDLYELVREATREDPQVPVLLVVNRTPPGTTPGDKRVREIVRNAADSIQREPELFLIASARASGVGGEGASPLPDALSAWQRVATLAGQAERLDAVKTKLVLLLRQVTAETEAELERRLLRFAESDEERQAQEAMIERLRVARHESLEAVERSSARLQRQVTLAVSHLRGEMQAKLHREIDASGKWLGHEACTEWLQQHALPFEVRQAARRIEGLIEEELTRLDEELEQIANTALIGIQRDADLPEGRVGRLAENLIRTLLQRAGGQAINGALRGLGGVGGAAAGAGNLVKMLVKKTGQVFGKTFGREVYRGIGKTFTKRFLQKLNVAVSILVEIGTFVWDAHRWKGQLKERLNKTLTEWEKEVEADLRDDHLPAIRARNEAGVRGIYDDLIRDSESVRPKAGAEERRQELESWCRELHAIRMALESFSSHGKGVTS